MAKCEPMKNQRKAPKVPYGEWVKAPHTKKGRNRFYTPEELSNIAVLGGEND